MKNKFFNGECYHVFNRGVEKRNIFSDKKDCERFLISLKAFNCKVPIGNLYEEYFRADPGGLTSVLGIEQPSASLIVEIIAYCLNPNHFHLILKQKTEGGISKFMQKLMTGYTMYFNKKYNRLGVLFQGRFKAVQIDTNEQLLYLSAYVNRNYFIHGYTKNLKTWPFCSYPDYIGERNEILCNKDIILSQFNNNFDDYKKFCENSSNYSKERKDFTKYYLE